MRIVTCGKLRVSFVSFMLVHLPTVALAYPSLSINDVTVGSEGNSGTTRRASVQLQSGGDRSGEHNDTGRNHGWSWGW